MSNSMVKFIVHVRDGNQWLEVDEESIDLHFEAIRASFPLEGAIVIQQEEVTSEVLDELDSAVLRLWVKMRSRAPSRVASSASCAIRSSFGSG